MSYPGRPYYPEQDTDDILVDFEHSEVRVAKVPHQCCACSQPIRVGQHYTRILAIVEGNVQVQKFHGHVPGECVNPNVF